jgi:hypothetical protein
MWLSRETTHAIQEDGVCEAGANGAAKTISWSEIATVRIGWADPRKPGKVSGPRVHFFQIFRKGGLSPSMHFTHLRFTGLLTFEDQAQDYNAFVRTLVSTIAEKAPHASFVTGSDEWERRFLTGLVWALAAGALIFAGMTLGGFWGEVDLEFPLFFGAVGLALVWLGWKVYGWNGPKPIDPKALPDSLFAPV